MTDEHEQMPTGEQPVPEPAHEEPVVQQEPAPVVSKSDTIDATIKAWFDAHVRNSPVARNTEAWNHLQAKLPALRDAILKEI